MRNFLLVLFVSILCACGGDDDDGSGQAPGSEKEGSSASEGGSGAEGEPTGDASGSVSPNCGNGIVEEDIGEECDDGNTDDTDGCTALCEFGCHSDSECQEDECAGAGSTCDLEFHYCTAGEGAKPDGEPCGMNGSCRSGACVEHECNNGYQEADEECDDGDSDNSNGCTIDCKYSCVTGDDSYPACDNPCDPLAYCDDATHACVADAPLADDTICMDGDGYCSNGTCIPSVCGDGEVQPNEDCDSADPAADPACQPDCTFGICGNGVIEGREQCDDGNTDKLDGCGPECKAEVIANPVTFGVTGEAPDFCVYEGNAFGVFLHDMMDAMVEAMQTEEGQQTMDEIESAMDESGQEDVQEDMEPVIPLFHLFDIDDLSMKSPDSLIFFGLTFATAETDAERTGGVTYMNGADSLDFPVNLYRVCYDDQLDPIANGELELKVENDVPVIYDKEPFAMGFHINEAAVSDDMRNMMNLMAVLGIDMTQTMDGIMNAQFVIRNIKVRIEVDPGRSKMPAPPETASETFESAGHFDPAFLEQVYENTGGLWGDEDSDGEDIDISEMGNPFDIDNELLPTGTICGTLHADTLGSIPLPNINMPLLGLSFASLCPNESSQLIPCLPGMSPEEGTCSAILDLLKIGCSGGDVLTLPPLGEPDADTDGDGTNDSYTLAIRLSFQRLKISPGYADGEPMMLPAVVD